MPSFPMSMSVATSAANKLVTQANDASTKMQAKAQAALTDRLGSGTGELTKRLQKGSLKAMDKNQTKNLAESKLADTVFKSGPKDDLMAVDVLGISDTGIRNSLTGKLTGFASNLLASFKNNGVTDLSSIIRAATGNGYNISSEGLKDRVFSAMGGTSALIRSTSDALQKTLTEGFGIPPEVYNQVEGVVNEVSYGFNSNNVKDANAIFGLVNQLTGNKETAQFFDVGAEANLLSGLFHEAIQLGVPNAVDALVLKAKSDKAADYALRSNVQVAVLSSDLQTTSMMVDRLGINRIQADLPNSAELLIANYKIPTGTTATGLAAELTKLVETLDKLKPGWSSYSRNGVAVSDLSIYSYASEDAKRVLSRSPTHLVAMTVAAEYRSVAMVSQAKDMYPFARL